MTCLLADTEPPNYRQCRPIALQTHINWYPSTLSSPSAQNRKSQLPLSPNNFREKKKKVIMLLMSIRCVM